MTSNPEYTPRLVSLVSNQGQTIEVGAFSFLTIKENDAFLTALTTRPCYVRLDNRVTMESLGSWSMSRDLMTQMRWEGIEDILVYSEALPGYARTTRAMMLDAGTATPNRQWGDVLALDRVLWEVSIQTSPAGEGPIIVAPLPGDLPEEARFRVQVGPVPK